MNNKDFERFYSLIGNEIRIARSKSGLSQTDLFNKTGIHRETISRLENGTQQVSLHQLILLCRAFEVDTNYFLDKVADYEFDA